ncbi:hypothetical protein V502_07864 [Pseudogymnoascus sp. VKM F-4520 (FW-2644)]|nr:hypothetical protein V502_07864 [Pseudogymnoascus sp. VKM F-4520 (FW-2644)]
MCRGATSRLESGIDHCAPQPSDSFIQRITPTNTTPAVPIGHRHRAQYHEQKKPKNDHIKIERALSPPPQYPQQGASYLPRPYNPSPPPFSHLDDYHYATASHAGTADEVAFTSSADSASVPAYAPLAPKRTPADDDAVAETKAALPRGAFAQLHGGTCGYSAPETAPGRRQHPDL